MLPFFCACAYLTGAKTYYRRSTVAGRLAYLKAVDEGYINDAYHSLSIEGYRVSAALIERVRRGNWNPAANAEDLTNRDAMAARGYHDAFVSARSSVERVLRGEPAGDVAREDHADWYRQLFGPSVTAGIVKATDLAGYIHPYIDGNGRIGRFQMNVMLASGGYPWTVIPVERRDDYMAALEAASVRQDIRPFGALLADLVSRAMTGQAAPAVPVDKSRP